MSEQATKKNSVPERVWVAISRLLRGYGYTYLSTDSGDDLVEYVRADLVPQLNSEVAEDRDYGPPRSSKCDTHEGFCACGGYHGKFPPLGMPLIKPDSVPASLNSEEQGLLPRPFCGGKAVKGMFSVWCDNCKAETQSDSSATSEQIIARWNTRATQATETDKTTTD